MYGLAAGVKNKSTRQATEEAPGVQSEKAKRGTVRVR